MNKLEKFVSEKVLAKLTGRKELHLQLTNMGWLVSDKVIRLIVLTIINVQVTNYLGADQYGLMNVGLNFGLLFAPLCTLGLEPTLVRELVKTPEKVGELLGSSWILKVLGTTTAIVSGTTIAYFAYPESQLKVLIVFLQLCTYLFLSLEVLDAYYQSKTKQKFTVYARNGAFLIFAAIKLGLLYTEADLLTFVLAQLGEYVLALVFQVIIYLRQGETFKNWGIKWKLAFQLLAESWPQALSAFMVMLYMRMDVVMLDALSSEREAGIYVNAVRFSELWYFVPLAMVSSVLPALVKAFNENYELFLKKYQHLADGIFWLAVFVGFATQFLGPFVIEWLFKPEFWPSADILSIHIWGGVFATVGAANVHVFFLLKKQKANLYRTLMGAILNLVLNFLLIPKYGGIGAAYATLAANAFAAWLSTFLFKETRFLFSSIFRSLAFWNLGVKVFRSLNRATK